MKYYKVELQDGVECVIYNKPTIKEFNVFDDSFFQDEMDIADVVLDKTVIENPVYKSEKDFAIGDEVSVPVGKTEGNRAIITEIVDEPEFLVRDIEQ